MRENSISKVQVVDFIHRKGSYYMEPASDLEDILSRDHDFYCFDNLLYDGGWYFVGGPEKFDKTVISGMCGTYKIEVKGMPEEMFREKYGDRDIKILEEDCVLHQRHIMAGLSHIIFDEMLNLFFMKDSFGRTEKGVIYNNPNPDAKRAFDIKQFPQGWEWWLENMTGMEVMSPEQIKGPVLFKRVMTGWITPKRFWNCPGFAMKKFRMFVLKNLGLNDLPEPEGIVFVDRPYRDKHSRRAILNMDEVRGMLEEFPDSEIVAMEELSFREQVKKAALARVFITAHGAAMTHVFFMQPGAAGIEIMPYNFSHDLYEKLAGSVDVNYHSFDINKDNSRLSEDILKGILANRGINADPGSIIEEILENNTMLDSSEFPLGLTRNDLKPLFRDQQLYVDTERLRNIIRKYV